MRSPSRTIETGEVKTVPAIALFIFIGAMPHTSAIAELIECDERGFILSGPDLIANGRRPRNWTAAARSAICSKQMSPAFSWPATCVTARSSAWPPPSAKDRSPLNSCINI